MQYTLKRIWYLLCRMDTASILIATVLLLAMLGSCFPQQLTAIESSPENQARWENDISARYGGLTDILISLGAFQFFHTPYFMATLFLLGIATLLCTLNRWRATWRLVFHREVLCPDSMFDVARQTANLTFPTIPDLPGFVREVLEHHGFRVRSVKAGDSLYLRADRNRLAPLATLATHLGLMLLLLGAILSGLFGWRRIIQVGTSTSAQLLAGKGTELRYEGLEIERYADGSVENYRVKVALSNPNQPPQSSGIRVNQPLKYEQVSIYLQDFKSTQTGESITLLEVYDPGYWLVILSGFILLVGMTVSFNFPHCCVFARIEAGSDLHLAGRAKKQAVDFDREFAALVEDLQRQVSPATEGEKRAA